MKSSQRTAAGVVGVVATVLLHSILFAVATWGVGITAVARLPDAVGAGANLGRPDGTTHERMIVIQLSTSVDEPNAELAATSLLEEALLEASMLEIAGPDILPPPPLVFDTEGEPIEASDADLIARTQLAGIYESQIRARIERAWAQPKEALNTAKYFCRVTIRQLRDGRVDDVTLGPCEGSLAWLDSLERAIKSASPLPGPPHPSVFVDTFSLEFRRQ